MQIEAPHFQLFVTIFAFLQNIPGMWSPTSTFVGCFGISANYMASVVKAEKERVWSLYSHCLDGCILEHIPGQAVYTAGVVEGLSLCTGHPTGQ